VPYIVHNNMTKL